MRSSSDYGGRDDEGIDLADNAAAALRLMV